MSYIPNHHDVPHPPREGASNAEWILYVIVCLMPCFLPLMCRGCTAEEKDHFPGRSRFAVMFQGVVGEFGFDLRDHNQHNSVCRILPEGKAAQLGIQEGWVLEKIGNEVVVKKTANQINRLLTRRRWPVELTFVVTETRNENYVPPDIEMQP